MTMHPTTSRKNGSSQIPELHESPVKCDHFKIDRQCESCQIGVRPDVRRKQSTLSQRPPRDFDFLWFFGERHMDIGKQFVIQAPCLPHRHTVIREDCSICNEAQESQLRDSSEATTLNRSRLKPGFGSGMMLVRPESERDPEIDIRKMHLPDPESRQSFRWSDVCFQDSRTVRAETQSASGSWRPELLALHGRSHSPQPLQAATSGRQAQPHHFERVLEFPCSDYCVILGQSQGLTNHPLAKDAP